MYEILESGSTYGVSGKGVCIPDVSSDRDIVQELIEQLNAHQVAEEHIYDVIENWFGQQAYDAIAVHDSQI